MENKEIKQKDELMEGLISSFNEEKGYSFIITSTGKSYFGRAANKVFRLYVGEPVSFNTRIARNGKEQACNIKTLWR